MSEAKIWKVSVRSQKGQHHIEAANVKDADGKLVFTDIQGNLVGSFWIADVQGYSVESGAEPVYDGCMTFTKFTGVGDGMAAFLERCQRMAMRPSLAS